MEMLVKRTGDFAVSGSGEAAAWSRTDWMELSRVGGSSKYLTRCKALYSDAGLYFLVECEDRTLTCTLTADNADLYTEDVVEVFLWPDESQPLYFEYEISPLDYQLPILVSNNDGSFYGWLAWHLNGNRAIRHATSVTGGPKASMAKVDGWACEVFIPFALFTGLRNARPSSGSVWRGNVYRIDYEGSADTHWAWEPRVAVNFHDYPNFGTLRFE